jgi:nucleoid DNA-binding protein
VQDIKLTKAEIIDSIHDKMNGINKKEIQEVMDRFFQQIKQGLSEDKSSN